MTKSLKISNWVHRELKIYSVKEGKNITDNADEAIIVMLKTKGHKFGTPQKLAKRELPKKAKP